ncbi:MAG: heavy metal-associated domain-containing protein [Vicinamibacterales bacterium]|nr:heavy metal-associated domain-containing protein [Vicinamibacterales bacterium]
MTTLSVAGMTCGACVRHVTRALEHLPGVRHVDVDLRANRATVEHEPAGSDVGALIAAIEGAGYTARVPSPEAGREPRGAKAAPACACCTPSPATDARSTGTGRIG